MSKLNLTPWRLFAFAAPSAPIAAMGLPIAVFLPPFYATEMGLGLATVGWVFMVARFWDVFTDPVLGILSDKYATRWGRRRHWMVLSVPVLMVSVVMVYMPVAPVSWMYLLGWMIILYIGWTLITVSQIAWGAELTPDYHKRSLVQGWRESGVILGMLLVLILPAVIDQVAADGVENARVAAMGWFVLILLPLTVALAVTQVGERKVPEPQHVPFREAIGVLVKNRPLQQLLAGDLANGIAGGTMAALYIFVASDVLKMGPWSSAILLAYFGAGVLFVPLIVRLSYRFGKHQTLAVSSVVNAAAFPLIYLVGEGQIVLMAIFTALFGINLGAASFLMRSMMADVADHDAVETGQQRTGLFIALLTMTQKVGAALAVGLSYQLLDLFGYVPKGEANSDFALAGVIGTFVFVPVTLYLVLAYLMWKFPLDENLQLENRRVLDERYAAASQLNPME